jgi:uroporphyrinogen decarboxylase
MKRLLFESPAVAHRLFEKLTQTLIPYLQMQIRAGARMVQIFDSWGGELGPEEFASFTLPYVTRMVQAAQREGVPVIYFGTSMSTLLPLMKRTGADVIGLDWRIDMAEGRRILGPEVAVQGNLDPYALFLPTGELQKRVRAILENAGPVGHIFNLGHGIFPQADPEKARALVNAVHAGVGNVDPPPPGR